MPWLWHSPTMTRRGVDAECRSDGAFFGPRSRAKMARALARSPLHSVKSVKWGAFTVPGERILPELGPNQFVLRDVCCWC
jgi:hypothetical protein